MITPINKKVLVERHEVQERSAGGIILAPQAQKPPLIGTVIAVGPNTTQVKEGQNVLFQEETSIQVKIADKSYLLFEEDNLLLIL